MSLITAGFWGYLKSDQTFFFFLTEFLREKDYLFTMPDVEIKLRQIFSLKKLKGLSLYKYLLKFK